MPFKKGHKKVGGKVKGQPNQKTILWDSFVEHSLNGGLEKFKTELNSLKGYTYVSAYLTLLEYMKPKRARVDEDGQTAYNVITVIPPTSKK